MEANRIRDTIPPSGESATAGEAPVGAYARLESLRINLGDADAEEQAGRVVDELLAHRRAGRGKVIGLAGLPRHGKTKLAERLREHAAQRPGADQSYNKTERGEVNVYYIPGRRHHHALIDLAGEDFQVLGQYDRPLPRLMERFLWPVLGQIDGMIMLAAFPTLWAGWNDPASPQRRAAPERERTEMRAIFDKMMHAHRTLLKYTLVAKDRKRLAKRHPQLGLDGEAAPDRDAVDTIFQAARPLAVPVCVAFSKADLYRVGPRAGLHPPGPGRSTPIDPDTADPLMVGWRYLPELFAMLESRVRHFRFDFVQAFEDPSDEPDPAEAHASDMAIDTLVGAESALEFVTAHPWNVPGLRMSTALRIDRLLSASRWNGGEPRGGD